MHTKVLGFDSFCDMLSADPFFSGVLDDISSSLVGDHVKGWDQQLGQAEFTFNHSVNRSTGFFPFQIVYGFVPRSPLDLVPVLDLKRVHGKAEDFIKQLSTDEDSNSRTNSFPSGEDDADIMALAYMEHRDSDVIQTGPKDPSLMGNDLTSKTHRFAVTKAGSVLLEARASLRLAPQIAEARAQRLDVGEAQPLR
ncbi:hypothetical protein Acr_07g0012820 [Actinidia rufa]|uniref:Uncharacterized protein n=1 Tax=Actinidia rufa TaxID=165716 RepID=A0A7J0EY28_9ERIC|nr:hypothetical protein Acr_07g0012820 [Actinidia rufa]